jgi:Bacterial protein of unknown function (DUF839)
MMMLNMKLPRKGTIFVAVERNTTNVSLLQQQRIGVLLLCSFFCYSNVNGPFFDSSMGFVTALSLRPSSSFLSSSLFRCNDTTTTSVSGDTCMYGVSTMMHSFLSDGSGNSTATSTAGCVERCVYFTGLVSDEVYHCGKCPTTTSSNNDNTTTTNTNPITYQPGNLSNEEAGLILSVGLTAKVIAVKKEFVQYSTAARTSTMTFTNPDGSPASRFQSAVPFHEYTDAGATFVDPRPTNAGGWIYVSNSEYRYKFMNRSYLGGVGAITFDRDGNVLDYRKILYNTTANCGGGKTPWNTWISCEEHDPSGTCYEVDPTGGYYTIPATTTNTELRTGGHNISMTNRYRGMFESFAYDIVQTHQPHFYVTKDDPIGDLRRYTPTLSNIPNMDVTEQIWKERSYLNTSNNPYYHTVLTQRLEDGAILEFLVVVPDANNPNQGTYYWTTDQTLGSQSAALYFQNCEGIDVVGTRLFFISKVIYSMFILDLTPDENNTLTYRNVTTQSGLFDGQPDQVDIVLQSTTATFDNFGNAQYPNTLSDTFSENTMLLYFTEDTNRTAGIHARTVVGDYVTILQSTQYVDETVGIAFSPNYQYMYFGYQNAGTIFQISRTDQYPFYGKTLDVKYHNIVDNKVDA